MSNVNPILKSTSVLAIGLVLFNSAYAGIYAKSLNSRPSITPPKMANKKWTLNRFGKKVARAALTSPIIPPLPPSAGTAEPWQASFAVNSGAVNLATGNLTLVQNIVNWTSIGPSVNFSLIFNNQQSTATSVGDKWRHSYSTSIVGTMSNAVVTYPDGKQHTFSKTFGTYTSPAGHYEVLTDNVGGGWTLTFKDGSSRIFNSSGQLTSIKDQYANTASLSYSSGNLISLTDAAGRALNLTYSSGKLSTITDFEGRTWTLSYNGSGQLTSVAEPSLGGGTYTTQYGYNGSGYVSSRTNRLGKTWLYNYQGSVFFSQQDPLGHYSGASDNGTPEIDQNGYRSQQRSVEPIGIDMLFVSLELPYVVVPDSSNSTYPTGTTIKTYVEDPSGCAQEYGFDASGTLTAYRDGNGNQTNLGIDTKFNRTNIFDPGGAQTILSYDVRGNNTSVTDQTSRTSQATFDSLNNVTSTTDSAGKVTSYTFTGYRLASMTDATGNTTTYSVGTNGLMNSSTDPAGKTYSYTYTAAGETSQVSDPQGNITSYTYAYGRPITRTDARNRTTSYSYDSWGRKTGVDYPVSTDQQFTYDAEGQMLSATDGTGTRTYTYDDLGRKIAQTDPRGNTAATYDDAGKLLSQTDVTGRLVQFAYDGTGRVQQVNDPSYWIQYQFDTRNRISQTTYSNGMNSQYTYDGANRVTGLTHKTAANVTVIGYTASYDTAGRLSSVVEAPSGATTSYSYDFEGRPLTENRTGATPYASTYTYNSRGLRATGYRTNNGVVTHDASYAYDDSGHLTTVSESAAGSTLGGSYTWYSDGNMATLPGPGYTRKLDYDEEGNLTKITKGYAGNVDVVAYEYAYGFDGGRRWRKDIAGGVWDWYPCGVACCAGELVALRSTNNGSTWSANVSWLSPSPNATFRNGEVLLPGLSGAETVVNTSGVATTSYLDDNAVLRGGSSNSLAFTSPTDETPLDEDLYTLAQALQVKPKGSTITCQEKYDRCVKGVDDFMMACTGASAAIGAGGLIACGKFCGKSKNVLGCIACLVAVGAISGGLYYICWQEAQKQRDQCLDLLDRCRKKQKKPVQRKPIKATVK